MPALPTYLIEPIWEQFAALLPDTKVEHPLGCHRPRIPNRLVFEKPRNSLRFWSSAAPTGESLMGAALQPPCAVGAMNGSLSGSWTPSGR